MIADKEHAVLAAPDALQARVLARTQIDVRQRAQQGARAVARALEGYEAPTLVAMLCRDEKGARGVLGAVVHSTWRDAPQFQGDRESYLFGLAGGGDG